jgi:hypothetical protein
MSRIRTGAIAAAAIALLCGFYASAALGKSNAKTIKLSAVVKSVGGQASGNKCRHADKVTLSAGKKSAGTINITSCTAAGLSAFYKGSATLDVGKLKGKLTFNAQSSPQPPKFTTDKTTAYFRKQTKTEDAHWNGRLPDTKGAHFKILLTDKVQPTA